jgi:hypothetical protein
MKKEFVYTVDVFWDGPIAGAADFESKPFYFDAVEDDVATDDGGLNFTLIELNEEIFGLISHNIEIKKRWQIALEKGETTLDTEPALPEEKAQFEKNRAQIDNYLFGQQSTAIIKKGIFFEMDSGNYEVIWS